jgi:uncharacterized cupredoxin-like copper-binding protein
MALLPLAALALVAAGCGSDSKTGSNVVEVKMTDNAFSPATFDAKAGKTVTFHFTNDGKVVHEAIIGDQAAQDEHEKEMAGGADSDSMHSGSMDSGSMGSGHMANAHDESMKSGEVTVQPGESADLKYTFSKSGTVIIGCHEPGHYKSGMKATVTVT